MSMEFIQFPEFYLDKILNIPKKLKNISCHKKYKYLEHCVF